MTQTIINLGTGGAILNGQNGSTASADSNDALFLDWPGDNNGNYVYLPGVASNYLSVPDEAALDITGDIDIRALVAADDWSPSAGQRLVTKYGIAGERSFLFSMLITGALSLSWSVDGTSILTRSSTVVTGIADGSAKWVRVTLDVDNGASGHDVLFFISDDGVTWSQLGTTVTSAGSTSIFSSSTAVLFGDSVAASAPLAAKVYRAQILNGIGGTTVLDVDTSVITTGSATTFNALTGQTVTINRGTAGRKTVAVVSPVWLLGTDDYIEVADNALLDFGATDSFTVLAIVRQWATTNAFAYPISKQDGANDKGYALRNFSGDNVYGIVGDGTNTTNTGASPQSFTLGALTSAGVIVNRTAQTLRTFMNGTLGTTSSVSTVGDTSNSQPLQVGRNAGFFTSQEVIAVAVFRRALTATEITQISDYYQARLS